MCHNCHNEFETETETVPPVEPMVERIASLSYQWGIEQGARQAAERQLAELEKKNYKLATELSDIGTKYQSAKSFGERTQERLHEAHKEIEVLTAKLKRKRSR